MLIESGVDFDRLSKDGIDPYVFFDAFTATGLVLNKNVTWITFSAGFDFAYLLKYLTGEPNLPLEENQFEAKMQQFFPRIIDMKLLAHAPSSLVNLGHALGATRIGQNHQAGKEKPLKTR